MYIDRNTEEIIHSMSLPVGISHGDSLILKTLDEFGQIWLSSVMHVTLADNAGEVVSEDFQYLLPERRLVFPEAKLTLSVTDGGALLISSDKFARCVELNGDADGDAFGWHFEDNYFDLMPGQTRKIKIYGKHSNGIVTAKAYYSPHATSINWQAEASRA